VAIGGAVQIIPAVVFNSSQNVEDRIQQLYTPLELAGRDVYISEGCYNCHSQMIRTLEPDVMRYGDYSRLGESIYDHPFQWGSKRTGPDLAREGGRRGDDWHFNHFINPRALDEGSNMPNYHFLLDQKVDLKGLPGKIAVQRKVGVPYEAMTADVIKDQAQKQALDIATGLIRDAKVSVPGMEDLPPNDQIRNLSETQLIALIAYVQKLGAYDEVEPTDKKPGLFNDPDTLQD
jgi:cytochrome c oxidase cbb3-type subunit I/II